MANSACINGITPLEGVFEFENKQRLPLDKVLIKIATEIFSESDSDSDEDSRDEDITIAIKEFNDSDYDNYMKKVEAKYKNKKLYTEDEVHALDKYWVDRRLYICYSPLPKNKTPENISRWFKRAHVFEKHLEFFAAQPYHIFWSYLIFEPQVSALFDSFLEKAVPCYLPQPEGEFRELYSKIYDWIFLLYRRILTAKVSETEYMLPETMGNLLIDHNVITNEVIWDLVRIYGHADDGTLEEMIKFAYRIMKPLENKLHEKVSELAEVFEGIGTTAYESDAGTEDEVLSLSLSLLDLAYSINIFMKLYEPFKSICVTEDFFSKLVYSYMYEIPILTHLMRSILIDDKHIAYEHVLNARKEVLTNCHNLLTHCIDQIFRKQEDKNEQQNWIKMYLAAVDVAIDNPRFLVDFSKAYPIASGYETIMDICFIDREKLNLIQKTITEYKENKISRVDIRTLIKYKIHPDNEQNEGTLEYGNMDEATLEYGNMDEAALPENVVLESKITEVLDVFHGLGDGFVEKCLLAMDLDTERVIAALLEDKLPPELAALDRTLPRIPPELPEQQPTFDQVYIGKKPSEHKDLKEMLDDKRHVRELRQKFLELTMVDEDNIYNDDYSEPEDEGPRFSLDVGDPEEPPRPRYLNRGYISDEEEEEDDEEKPEASSRPKDAFCEDPAVIRARREAKYQQQRTSNKVKDVVGKPKGQGQDKNVLQNREKKKTHKSSRANHSRRAGAQWKRSRGMMPS